MKSPDMPGRLSLVVVSGRKGRIRRRGGIDLVGVVSVVTADVVDRVVETRGGVPSSELPSNLVEVLQAVPASVRHRGDEHSAGDLLVVRVARYDAAELVADDLVGDRVPAHYHRLVECPLRKEVTIGRVAGRVVEKLRGRLVGAGVSMTVRDEATVPGAACERGDVTPRLVLRQALVESLGLVTSERVGFVRGVILDTLVIVLVHA